MKFMEEPITANDDAESLESAISRIVSGPETYKVKLRGSLLVIYPTLPQTLINRVLSLELGQITYKGTTIADLDETLSYAVEGASGSRT
jgi:hypothetical protein